MPLLWLEDHTVEDVMPNEPKPQDQQKPAPDEKNELEKVQEDASEKREEEGGYQ